MNTHEQALYGSTMRYLGFIMHRYRSNVVNLLQMDGYSIHSYDTDKRVRLTMLKALAESPTFKNQLSELIIGAGKVEQTKAKFSAKGANGYANVAGTVTGGAAADCTWVVDGYYDSNGNPCTVDAPPDYSGDISSATDFLGNTNNYAGTPVSPGTSSSTSSLFNTQTITALANDGLNLLSSSINKSTLASTQANAIQQAQLQLQTAQTQAAASLAPTSSSSAWMWILGIVVVGVFTVIVVKVMRKRAKARAAK